MAISVIKRTTMKKALKNKIVAGITASSCDFKYAPELLADTAKYCDYMIIRFDSGVGNRDGLAKVKEAVGPFVQHLIVYEESVKFNKWNWRESLIRRLDVFRPDIVIAMDDDECFGEGIVGDLNNFQHSCAQRLDFKFEMATMYNKKVPLYPFRPHTKVFKWQPDINYIPYKHFARPNIPRDDSAILADSLIKHYCFWDKEERKDKTVGGDIVWENHIYRAENKKLLDVIPSLDK